MLNDGKWLRWSVRPCSSLITAPSVCGVKRIRGVGSTGTAVSMTTDFSSLMVTLYGLDGSWAATATQPTASNAASPLVDRLKRSPGVMAHSPVNQAARPHKHEASRLVFP